MSDGAPELSSEELEAQEATELPEREAMSIIDGPIANPANVASVVNFMSDGASQTATQSQDVSIVQQR